MQPTPIPQWLLDITLLLILVFVIPIGAAITSEEKDCPPGLDSEPGNAATKAVTVYGSSSTTTSTTSTTIHWPVLNVLGQGRGYGQGNMYDPSDVAVGSDGRAYVLEAYNSRIQVFTREGSSEKLYGTAGNSGLGELDEPDSIALREIDENLTEIVVADTSNHRVQELWLNKSNDGENWTAFGEHLYGEYKPSTHIYFDAPRGVDVDPTGRIFVSDTGDDRVNVFVSTEWIKVPRPVNRSEINGSITPDGWLTAPTGIAAEYETFYVAESGANRIRAFYVNGSQIYSLGKAGSGRGEFNGPGAIALDHAGHMFIADTGNSRIAVYTTDGMYVTSYGSMNCSTSIMSNPSQAMGQFCNPRGLDVRNNTLYVADSGNHRVQVINITVYPEPSCILIGDEEPCGQVEVAEIVALINEWAGSRAELADVMKLITKWAGQ